MKKEKNMSQGCGELAVRLMANAMRCAVAGVLLSLLMGQAQAQTVVNVAQDIQTRTSSFEYYTQGQVKKEIVEPTGTTALKLTSSYDYDTKGNRTLSKAEGWNGLGNQMRPIGAGYDADGLFPTSQTVYLTQTPSETNARKETREYDPLFGGVTKLIGPNGLKTEWDYDEFGRKTQERRGYASATATNYIDRTDWEYLGCDTGCVAVQGQTPAYKVLAKASNMAGVKLAPTATVYYDKLNREIRSETEGLKGGAVTAIYKDTVYNSRGLVQKVSLPYFASDTAQWVNYDYDDSGRKTSETAPNGLVTSTVYSVLQVTVTVNASAAEGGVRTRTTIQDVMGRTTQTINADGRPTYYVYDAKGNLTRTVDTYGNSVVMGYDLRGRKTSMSDPDMGSWSYEYNAFGELIKQTDAQSRATTLTYDIQGRMLGRVETDLQTYFEYDSASGKGIGKLAKTYTDNGYCRVHSYDGLGRPLQTEVRRSSDFSVSVDKRCDVANDILASSISYDANGRVDTQTYPTGVVLKQSYDTQLGFVKEVYNNTGNAKGAVYWSWKDSNAQGRVTEYAYANGVSTKREYDPITFWLKSIKALRNGALLNDIQESTYDYDSLGNLKVRRDKFDPANLYEKFEHDLQGRLTNYALYEANESLRSQVLMSYDAIGNIKTKSDVGTYYYNAQGQNSVRPHAVMAVRGLLKNDYLYNASGSMTGGAGRNLVYTSYEMVSEAGNANNCHRFVFQAEHARWQQKIYNQACAGVNSGTAAASTTTYVHPDAANGLSFEREQRGTLVTYKHYINAGGIVVGVLETQATGVTGDAIGAAQVTTNAQGSIRYFHYDHLGSVVAITDASATIIERRSFDPWGKPRNLNGDAGTGELPGQLNAASDRGFTMHEHLEGLGLVHMNGRVYDPTLARFVSADPFIQAMLEGQSYNRYSYVMNGPLGATDPSGYFLKWLARLWREEIWRRPVGRLFVSIGVGYLTGQWIGGMYQGAAANSILNGGSAFMLPGLNVAQTAGVLGGAAGGFAGGLVSSGGDLKSAAKGALTGGAFGFVGGLGADDSFVRYAGHALVGCASAMMDGGNCGAGAASALLGKFATNMTKGLNPVARGLAAAVAGGIGAELSGGSFKNGAMTAAYGYLFNELAHQTTAAQRGYASTVYRDGTVCPAGKACYNPLGTDTGGALVGVTAEVSTFVLDYSLTVDTDGRGYGSLGRSLLPNGSGGFTLKFHFAPEQWSSDQKFQFFDGMSATASAQLGPVSLGRSYSPVAGTSRFVNTTDFGLGSPGVRLGGSVSLSTCVWGCPK